MTRETIRDAVFAAIREEVDEPDLALAETMSAGDVAGWDSLAHVRIVLNIGLRVGQEIDISGTYEAGTIGELIDTVGRVA
jgi:acyl carrier protein